MLAKLSASVKGSIKTSRVWVGRKSIFGATHCCGVFTVTIKVQNPFAEAREKYTGLQPAAQGPGAIYFVHGPSACSAGCEALGKNLH